MFCKGDAAGLVTSVFVTSGSTEGVTVVEVTACFLLPQEANRMQQSSIENLVIAFIALFDILLSFNLLFELRRTGIVAFLHGKFPESQSRFGFTKMGIDVACMLYEIA